MMGVDPDYIDDPSEFETWMVTLIESQMDMVQKARQPEGQTRLREWIDTPDYVVNDKGEEVAGTPPEICQRFPRLVLKSLEGDLYATTALMMDEATDRASVAEYASLRLGEMPSRAGLLFAPHQIWPIPSESEETDFLAWVSAVSWVTSQSAVTVCWWESIVKRDEVTPHTVPVNIGLHHTWSMKFEGEKRWGRLGRPDSGDQKLSDSFHFIASGCELIKMLQEEIQTIRPVTPHPPKDARRRIKKEFGGRIPAVRTFDLRRRTSYPTDEQDKTGQGVGRTLKYRKPIRGHPRTIFKGTPAERVIWIPGSVQGRHLPPHPNERQKRIGLLRR
jgi:hypothetical protein